ncbi:MAG: trypsin-like peptidase domain-containing protein [Ardenticatenaceae bacterium]|nr:trypsin-like peptidase domain-containing protein [Ardenticatenaceae bacterium]MCB9443289.1 trypsin-like peptidase domain-containing protein [Ardenticatenaceae bacterium]
MKFLRQYPILVIILLLVLTAVACQIGGSEPPAAEINQETIVQEAVATVQAQLSQPSTTSQPIVETNLPAATNDLEASLISIYQRVNPAVVHIRIFTGSEDFNIPLGTGSGFLYDADGHIVTNNHVVTDGDRFEVVFDNGTRAEAVVVGTDVDSDLAVIKVDSLPEGVTPVVLGDSSAVQVGEFVAAIGNPFDETGSMSVGIVSGLGRTLLSQRVTEDGGRYSLPQVIQTDAAINPGNSGGPLLNMQGEVIGVNSAILTETGVNSGVGYTIPVNAVKRVVPALINNGHYVYPYIGIRMLTLDITLQEELGLSQTSGAYVTDVSPDTPADEAGLIGVEGPGGDLITAINGQPVTTSDDLISYLVFETVVGQKVNLTVVRDGQEIILPLTLGERP